MGLTNNSIFVATIFQKRYMLKFSTDGSMLTNKRNAVQGAVRVFQVDDEWKPIQKGTLPKYLNQELPVYYYLGKYFYCNRTVKKIINP